MKIGIIGAGNIGQTLKAMVASVDGVTRVTLGDNSGCGDTHVDARTGENLAEFVSQHDAVVNALPFHLNQPVARACAGARRSYFDFSEDVESTAFVEDLAEGEKELVFIPQCGLAPGAVNIILFYITPQARYRARPLSSRNEFRDHRLDGLRADLQLLGSERD